MLEQYQYHSTAHEKIVLISPGYVEWDIVRLGFDEVMWPSVFAKCNAPYHSAAKINHVRASMAAISLIPGSEAHLVDKQQVRPIFIEELGILAWEGKTVVGGYLGRTSLRLMEKPESKAREQETVMATEDGIFIDDVD
jgi:hypothetical protein